VDLTLRHIQVDAVECDDIAETLGDPTSPDCELYVHGPLLPNLSSNLGTTQITEVGW
jgi:hypothetical protein